MKHLDVLEEAGLVLVRARGRERWNYLNAVPIQEIYERWVMSYAKGWATGLSELRRSIEHEEAGTKMAESLERDEFRVADIEMEMNLSATPERVWQGLVNETSAWWGTDFCTSPDALRFVIEPTLGGRAYEDWGNGEGLTWMTVIGIQAPKMLLMQGSLVREFGGPATTITRFTLEPNGAGTTLKLSNTNFGALSPEVGGEAKEGWDYLFNQLKQHVESEA
jgi:uncharacterized protein YndB with AHSA1/START domain